MGGWSGTIDCMGAGFGGDADAGADAGEGDAGCGTMGAGAGPAIFVGLIKSTICTEPAGRDRWTMAELRSFA